MDNKKTKLHQLQERVGKITKDANAGTGSYSYKYFDINSLLEVIKPLINEIGITIVQPFTVIEGKSALQTIALDSETGEKLGDSVILLPELSDPQKLGSAITYIRRYSLQSMLLLEAEDDDAHSARPPVQDAQNHYSPPAAPVERTMAVQKCSCGGDIERFAGTSKLGKPYVKFTCQACKAVTWDNTKN